MRLLKGAIRLLLYAGVVVAAGLFILTQFFGLRVEMDGTGSGVVFSFHDPNDHYAELEAERAAEAGQAPEPAPVAPESSPTYTETSAAAAPESAAGVAAPAWNAVWPDYRGPNRDGASPEPIKTDWPGGKLDELWRTKVGGGYASMVVAQGRVFTIEQRRDQEVVAAYDLDSGVQIWEHGWNAHFQESMGGPGPRATPTWHEGKIYAQGAEGELRCLDAGDGSQIWRTNILQDASAQNVQWGMSGAPLIVDDKVIVHPGGSGKAVAAYDKRTGKLVWQSQSEQAGYASPALVELAGVEQVLVFGGSRLLSVAPEDGHLLWEHPWRTQYDINSAQPIVVDSTHLIVSSGYGHGASMIQVNRSGDRFVVEKVWENNNLKNKFNSSVLHQGHVYGLDEAILACIDARTGERKWKGGRYGYGQVLLAGNHVIVLTEKGEVALVKATPESHQEVARFSALEGKTWNTPAIADGKLLVRNQTEMAAYDLRP